MSLSGILLTSAAELLQMALHDRRRHVFRTRDNHFTPHAVGSILLLTAAFEAWLNEAISLYANMSSSPQLLELAGAPILVKYEQIPERLGVARLPPHDELRLMLAVRDEIAHFLPRGDREWEGNVPPAFQDLNRMGLLITSRTTDADFVFTQKLHSYRLAYWAWQVVDHAVSRFVEALHSIPQLAAMTEMIAATASNFKMYQRICPPEELGSFDAHYRLRITGDEQQTGDMEHQE